MTNKVKTSGNVEHMQHKFIGFMKSEGSKFYNNQMEIVMKLSINNKAKSKLFGHRHTPKSIRAFSVEHGVCKVFVPALQQYADTNISYVVTHMHAYSGMRCGAVSESFNYTELSNLNPILIKM